MAPAPLSTGFQALPPLPTIKLGPSGAGSHVGGLVHTLDPCGSLQRPLPWGWESLLLTPQPPRAFSIRGLRLYRPPPCAGALGCAVCLVPRLPSVPIYLCASVGPLGLLVVRLPAPFVPHSASLSPATATRVLSAPAARLGPSSRSGWTFIFYLLGVGLPCRSIFRQFWLCEEAQCVHLRRHLGSDHLFSNCVLQLSPKSLTSGKMPNVLDVLAEIFINQPYNHNAHSVSLITKNCKKWSSNDTCTLLLHRNYTVLFETVSIFKC